MENIQRYSCGNGEGMFDAKEGYWVTYEDYKNLLDKYNALKQVKNNGVLDGVIICKFCGSSNIKIDKSCNSALCLECRTLYEL